MAFISAGYMKCALLTASNLCVEACTQRGLCVCVCEQDMVKLFISISRRECFYYSPL